MFSGLLNAFEPYVVQCLTIPSLCGYSEILVEAMKYDDWVHFHDTVQAQVSLADVTSDSDIHGKSGSDHPEFREGIRTFKGKEAEFRYINSKEKETWFEEGVEKVLAIYRPQGVSKESLVLGLVA
ncbi:hypothetical protein F5887DRAFT_1074497 [Amanita rubescens]|nr:hypothetical protein F5887DRAFT_1074497 [Amanita rubescens]